MSCRWSGRLAFTYSCYCVSKNKAYKCIKIALFKPLICYDKVGRKINMAAKDEDAYDRKYMSFHSSTQLRKVWSQQELRYMQSVHEPHRVAVQPVNMVPTLHWLHKPGGQLRD